MVKLVAEIDEFKGRWEALKTLAPERLNKLRKVATIESIGSSTRIEGAKLTDAQVETLLSGLKTKSFQGRDEQEVAGYAEAMDLVFQAWEDMPITENHIRQLHQTLLRHSTKDERHRGGYKTLDNHVVAFGPNGEELGIVFATTSPFDTPREMEALVGWVQKAVREEAFHPLLIVAIFIVKFLAIHPFQDGNGRLSRVLTTLMLLRAGYAYVPYASLESVVEENKGQYYNALRRTQKSLDPTPDWEPWIGFFLRALKKQKSILEERVEGEKVDQITSEELHPLSEEILELFQSAKRLTLSEVVDQTGANRNTVKVRIRELVAGRQIKQHGKARSTWYSLLIERT
ncbi:Fic family protein [Robiginitomaculum antarcticum]|uniref:Fic family protein n=1 Tax=Robiginitomaculum antarcticum TaxID=437507 RepID=UPI001F19A626|nr:Fic family protein [Robiginitomaculum antarcticum]